MEIAASSLTTALLALYYLVLGVLALYGLHRLHLVWVWLRTRGREVPLPADPPEWPRVTVQLPLYNELYVAERLIDAVCRLDYPCDRLEIQVLDDSTDETREVVAAAVRRHRARGVDVHHLHRTDRTGFKAGALEAGTRRAAGELLAVFDADFVPPSDFLRRTVPHFQDPAIGMVQARWRHLNRGYSLLTRIQAMLLDGHFAIEHTARHRGGCFFNFNGTAGIWRGSAIEDAGGWEHDTLTEDLDLSYRAQLAGWRFLYLPDLGVPSELPVDAAGFKSQQHRWARGSIQTGRKLLWTILRAPVPWRVKAEAFVHLTNNMSYPLMVLLSILVFPAMVARQDSGLGEILVIDLPLFLGATVSVLIFYTASQAALGHGWRRRLWDLPALMGLGIGLSVSNARAALGGLFRMGGTFVRTPKYRIEDPGRAEVSAGEGEEDGDGKPEPVRIVRFAGGPDRRALRYRASQSLSFVVEGLFAAYFVTVTVLAVQWEMYLSLPFLWLFLQGYTYMFFLSVVSAVGRSGGLRRPRPA